MKKRSEKLKTKKIKKIPEGRGCLKIFSGFNNSIITITRENGEKLGDQISARTATGYSGAKKATLHAAREAAKVALAKIKEFGISTVIVRIRGIGNGGSEIIKEVSNSEDLKIEKCEYKIAFPFNGCRPRKAPRK